MTPEQFAALAELLRLRAGPAEQAARMVLVDGAAVADAARTVGLEYKAAHQAVKRAQRGIELARLAVAGPLTTPRNSAIQGYATADGRFMPLPIWRAWSAKQKPTDLAEWFPLKACQ